jgi:CheY-like chemotaxis protein
MRTDAAADGTSALATLIAAARSTQPFDVVLTDYHMPGMDGFEMVRRMRDLPEGRSVPVIMLSSANLRGHAAMCRALGIKSYFTKPVNRDDLVDALRSLALTGPAPDSPRPASQPEGAAATSAPLRLLVAEDNAINQKLILTLLGGKLGHQVTLANNGREAMQALEAASFDAVFMDIHMPEMDGLEAIRQIREREDVKQLPIYVLSAAALPEECAAGLAAGADGYLTKPINTKELHDALAAIAAAREPA